MIKTQLCDMLGIRYPLFQGGMAHISDARLAAAVSEAGGLGILSAASGDVAKVSGEIDKIRTLTDRPFGVNIMLLGKNVEELAALVAEKKVPVVTTGAGTPASFHRGIYFPGVPAPGKYIPLWKEAGVKVIPVVPSCAVAKLAARAGADAVIAEGGESGGHVGDLTTMALVPQVCDAVNIPVIAAGGLYDGRSVAASLMLGACGVQLGTRFLTAVECSISAEYKKRVLEAKDTSTIVTGKRLGHPVRSLKSPFSKRYFAAEYSSISDEELERMAVGTLRAAVIDGDPENGCFLAGQISGMVNREQTCKDIIEEIFEQTEKVLKGASQWVK